MTGCCVQVDHAARSVLRIVQLHQAPINALAVHERTCFTAADDGHLRMWPLDFAHVSLEASHAAAVTAVSAACTCCQGQEVPVSLPWRCTHCTCAPDA